MRRRGKEPATRARRRSWRARLFMGVLSGLFWVIVLGTAWLGYLFYTLQGNQGLFKIPEREPGLMLIARDGRVLAERGAFFGDEARIDELPRHLPLAVVAIEDRRFYHHWGVDVIGLARAMLTNLRAGRIVQGGSTLTQQLAKNLFLKHERTYKRKIQELLLAWWLEWRFTKNEILQLYLNRVYFGAGAWGVERAARRFFGKSARDVTIGEAAVLAGVLKAPSRYNPVRHRDRALARARVVLKAMLEAGYITRRQAASALRHVGRRATAARGELPATNYVVDWVLEQLPDLIGEFRESLVVETTIDRDLQRRAERLLRRTLKAHGRRGRVGQGALLVMIPDGAVRALIGGRSWRASQFNRAVHARRQPGSSFKPFVYLAALRAGFTPDTVIEDRPLATGPYRPRNYRDRYYGRVTLRDALARSLNAATVRLANAVGLDAVAGTARRLGVSSPLEVNAALALGASEVTMLEMAAAYAAFANGGRLVSPYVITRITTRSGKVLYERAGSGFGRVLSDAEVGAMNDMLRAVVRYGTGKAAAFGHDAAGKTGTTQNYRDAWFIGYSAHLVTAVWLGNDDNRPMRGVTGGSLPAAIFRDVMRAAHATLPPRPLPGTYRRPRREVARQNRRTGGGLIDFFRGLFGGGARPAPPPARPAPPPRRRQNFGPEKRRVIQNFGPAR